MAAPKRKISTRLIRKGALIEETYSVFQQWDLDASFRDNIQNVRDTNAIGANTERWLHEVLTTVSSRFSDNDKFAPLVVLAKGGFPLSKWRSCLLWHIGEVDELYYRFCTEWLYDEFLSGRYMIQTSDVLPFVHKVTDGRISSGGNLSEYGALRAARDLLRMATDFGLLSKGAKKQFTSFHLPEDCFLYVLHCLSDQKKGAVKILSDLNWRLFLMDRESVERELLNLHQYKKLEYNVAGSLAQIRLPDRSQMEYARTLIQ
jgi:hypothetical protein